MANPIVQLPLSEGAKSAAALRSAHLPENDESKSNMKKVTIPPPGEGEGEMEGGWSPSCKESSWFTFPPPPSFFV